MGTQKQELEKSGFTVINEVYTPAEVEQLLQLISSSVGSVGAVGKSDDLFAIRRFLKVIPQASPIIFNERLKSLIHHLAAPDYFVIKSIYFDKPPSSNWFVAYHQDLTISVQERLAVAGFGPWTKKGDGFAVKPPENFLEKNLTLRIHLDDTNEHNGALKVLPGSHRNGIVRKEELPVSTIPEVYCMVQSGGVMLMMPLSFHASGRTTDQRRRRVIHIELSNQVLPDGLRWSEYNEIG